MSGLIRRKYNGKTKQLMQGNGLINSSGSPCSFLVLSTFRLAATTSKINWFTFYCEPLLFDSIIIILHLQSSISEPSVHRLDLVKTCVRNRATPPWWLVISSCGKIGHTLIVLIPIPTLHGEHRLVCTFWTHSIFRQGWWHFVSLHMTFEVT